MTDKYNAYTVTISPFKILAVGGEPEPPNHVLCKFAADAINAGDYDIELTAEHDLPDYDEDEEFTDADDDSDNFGGFV